MALTLAEIRTAVQEGKHKPSDIFDLNVLTSDPYVKEHVGEKIDNAKGYDIRKRQDLETKVTTLEAEKKALQDELASSKTSVLKTRAREVFDAVLAERPKLKEDARLSKFVRKQFEKGFTPKEEAKLKDELNTFVDAQVSEFSEVMGDVKPDGKEKTAEEKAAEDAARATEQNRDKTNLLDPKNNDLIPA